MVTLSGAYCIGLRESFLSLKSRFKAGFPLKTRMQTMSMPKAHLGGLLYSLKFSAVLCYNFAFYCV